MGIQGSSIGWSGDPYQVQIILIGTSHHTAEIGLRERVAFNAEQAGKATRQLRSDGILREALVLTRNAGSHS